MYMEQSTYLFEKTGNWIKRNARPLESALWRYYFEEGSKQEVIVFLEAFQNEDGGFGNGLEPDFWLPKSSAIATWTAAKLLYDLDIQANVPIVQKLIAYLVKTYDDQAGLWHTIEPETNDFPHAPWWSWKEGIQENWMYNPSAELAGYLIHWSQNNPGAEHIGWLCIDKALSRVMEVDEMDFHEVNNYQQLVKVLKTNQTKLEQKTGYVFSEVQAQVLRLVEQVIEYDPSKWGESYLALPLDFIDSTDHPLYKKRKTTVEENIVYYLGGLDEEDIWDISWDWGTYPEVFSVARTYWKGILAVQRCKLFREFGLLKKD